MNRFTKDRAGERYGRLVLTSRSNLRSMDGTYKWHCLCDCGTMLVVAINSVRSGNTKSCGCIHKEKTRERLVTRNTTHGHSIRGSRTSTYRSWRSIFDRLNYDPDYAGVTISERYQSFENFLADMGERPSGTTIDRIDNSKGYEPGNLRWASNLTQANNRTNNVRVSHGGITRTLAEWARELNLKYEPMRRRFHKLGKPDDFISRYMENKPC